MANPSDTLVLLPMLSFVVPIHNEESGAGPIGDRLTSYAAREFRCRRDQVLDGAR